MTATELGGAKTRYTTAWWMAGLLLLALSGCQAAKTYKLATQLDEAGNDYKAALTYLEVLEIKESHAKALQALASVAQDAYEQKLAIASRYEEDANFPSALTEYRELGALLASLQGHGAVSFPVVDIDDKIATMEASAAEERYQAGNAAMEARAWDTAVAEYQAALSFKQGYKDARDKTGEAHALWGEDELSAKRWRAAGEQFTKGWTLGNAGAATRGGAVYAALGRHFLEAGECRQATTDLRLAAKLDPSLDLAPSIEDAEACAILPVAVLAFENKTGRDVGGIALGDALAVEISTELRRGASEFLRLLERDALAAVSAEGALAGDAGARYLVLGSLTQVTVDSVPPRPTSKTTKADEPFECTKTKSDGTSYKANCWREATVEYLEHQGHVRVTLAGSARVVDTKTSEQVASMAFDNTSEDSVAWADTFTLRGSPATLSLDAKTHGLQVSTSIKDLARETRRTLRSETELGQQALGQIAAKVASDVLATIDAYRAPPDPVDLAIR